MRQLQHDEAGPEKIVEVYDPKTRMHGIAVIDNTRLGPGKGGIRMTPGVGVDEVASLARAMTWKNALAELPFGGAKAGIIADSKAITKEQKRAIVEAFARALRPVCPSIYVAGPDMYMGEEEMGWFAKANGSPKACTGKPATMKGIPHELGSTGYGVYHAALAAAKHIGLDIKKATIAIEGFGNVGTFAAKFLTEAGAKLVAVSDSKGCIHNKFGIDYEKLMRVKQRTGSVVGYTGQQLASDAVVGVEADILIPAAKPDVINDSNKADVRAKIIVEGANIPMMPSIEEELHKRKVLVVPDIIANAGGVISSYVEHQGGKAKDVFPLVERKIVKNTKAVLAHAQKEGITPRAAALAIARKRVLGKRA
jgi:glutamate dehydrogenase/leucine dehydrogenase